MEISRAANTNQGIFQNLGRGAISSNIGVVSHTSMGAVGETQRVTELPKQQPKDSPTYELPPIERVVNGANFRAGRHLGALTNASSITRQISEPESMVAAKPMLPQGELADVMEPQPMLRSAPAPDSLLMSALAPIAETSSISDVPTPEPSADLPPVDLPTVDLPLADLPPVDMATSIRRAALQGATLDILNQLAPIIRNEDAYAVIGISEVGGLSDVADYLEKNIPDVAIYLSSISDDASDEEKIAAIKRGLLKRAESMVPAEIMPAPFLGNDVEEARDKQENASTRLIRQYAIVPAVQPIYRGRSAIDNPYYETPVQRKIYRHPVRVKSTRLKLF